MISTQRGTSTTVKEPWTTMRCQLIRGWVCCDRTTRGIQQLCYSENLSADPVLLGPEPADRALHGYADMDISVDISMDLTDMNTGFFHG